MKTVLCILLFSFAELVVGIEHLNPRIGGGASVFDYRNRFQGQLVVNENFICGAALVGRRHLVAPAHKVKFLTLPEALHYEKKILLGLERYLAGAPFIINRISYHRGFDESSTTYYPDNVAVIHLNFGVTYTSYHAPIFMVVANQVIDEGTSVFGIGYTIDTFRPNNSKYLRRNPLTTGPLSNCVERINGAVLTNNHICTTSSPGAGLDDWIDGGALLDNDQYTLLAIISENPDESKVGAPTIYTNLSPYRSFIEGEMAYDKDNSNTFTGHPGANFDVHQHRVRIN